MDEFKVKFRGVRGSFPVVGRNFLQFGGNTSCVELNIAGRIIILDAGTGIVATGDELMEKYISSSANPQQRTPIDATVLISHIHQDHLLGLTFFKPLHLKTSKLNIFGSTSPDTNMSKSLSSLIFGKTFPLDLGDIACNPNIQDIDGSNCILIKPNQSPQVIKKEDVIQEENDILITYYKSYVHPQDGVMIYKVSYKNKTLVYATDKECYMGGDKNFIKFAKNCDLLIHDAQYTTEDYMNQHSPKQGFGHSTYDMAIETMKQTNSKKLVFFHYEPSYNDTKLSRIKEHYTTNYKNAYMSYEGLEIQL